MKKAIKQSKLIFLLNFVSVIFLFLILISLTATIIQSKSADKANEDRFILTETATKFMSASSYMTSEIRAYAATGNKQHYDNYMNEKNQLKTRETSVTTMKAIGISSEEEKRIDEMLEISNELIILEEQSAKYVADGDLKNAATTVLSTQYNESVTQIANLKSEFFGMLITRTSESVNNKIMATRFFEIVTFIFSSLIVIMQLLDYRIIRKKVVKPIIAIEEEMRCIAQGNLSSDFNMEADTSEIGMLIDSILFTRTELKKYIKDIADKMSMMSKQNLDISIDIDYIGDFRPIKEALIKIVDSLNVAFYKINETADQVSLGSTQISSIAQDLASGTSEQSISIEHVSDTINKISEQVKNTAEKSYMAATLANTAGVQLGKSNEQLQGMLKAMNEISNASDEISKIIKTIEDIAFQTNTIALNAAVEAARAGEAGKSFAVVADEVRNLATKSAEASKSTSLMIENSLKTIQSGEKIAQNASETFITVMVNAGHAADAMSSITEDTKQQSTAVAQITESIEQVSLVIQNNCATSEETAVSSEELMQQSESLRKLVHEFQLKKRL